MHTHAPPPLRLRLRLLLLQPLPRSPQRSMGWDEVGAPAAENTSNLSITI